MNTALRTLEDYEYFIYSLIDRFPVIQRSTVTVVRMGATLARVAGELHLTGGFRIVVRERLVFDRLPGAIDWYGYHRVTALNMHFDTPNLPEVIREIEKLLM